MRCALLCGSVAGATVLAAALWSTTASLLRNPSAERFLLFELPALLLAGAGAAGLYLVGRGWPHREGQGLVCARCGHPWCPETNRLHTYCQECGAPWRWFGGRVQGRPMRRPGLILAGAALCLLALAVVVLRETAAARLVSSAPTWLLIRTVELMPWYESRVEWNELTSRTLSRADTELLARAVLQKRQRERSITSALASWYQSGIQSRTIPAVLGDRWFDEMFEVRLSVPQRAVVGEGVPVVARAHYLGGWLGVTEQAQVVVVGLTAGDDAVRTTIPRPVPAAVFSSGAALASETIYPEKPGPLTVRLRAYFLIGSPTGMIFNAQGEPVTILDAQGVPVATPMTYMRAIEIERTVEVDPAPEPR